VLGIFWLIVLSGSLLSAIYFVPLVCGFFSTRATGAGALAGMAAGAVATIGVFALNQQTGSHWFVHELFAGLGASFAAWWIVSRLGTPTREERAALASLAR
jgi:sodium/pantothenate symporter